jgi:hypothetical protein
MNALEAVASRLREKEQQLTEFLADGGAKDYAHYQSIVGELKGIMFARNETKDMNDKLLKDDDE